MTASQDNSATPVQVSHKQTIQTYSSYLQELKKTPFRVQHFIKRVSHISRALRLALMNVCHQFSISEFLQCLYSLHQWIIGISNFSARVSVVGTFGLIGAIKHLSLQLKPAAIDSVSIKKLHFETHLIIASTFKVDSLQSVQNQRSQGDRPSAMRA